MRVGQAAVVKDLQQGVEHIGVRFFDLIEQHDRVWAAADLFGQLPGLVIADIARGRTDQAGNRVLFHIFRHIQPHQCVRRIEQVERELFDQLGFAHAGRSDKQERRGLALGADARARAADGRADRVHGLVLADHM